MIRSASEFPRVPAALCLFSAAAVASVGLASATVAPARADETIRLVPHRAIYRLENVQAQPGTGIADVTGAIYFDLRLTCTDFVMKQQFLLEIVRSNNRSTQVRTEYSSAERRDGTRLSFETKTTSGGRVTDEFAGTATLTGPGGTGTATLSRPSSRSFALVKGTFFPTTHTIEMIRRAKAGDLAFWGLLYDGSDGDKLSGVNTTIGALADAPAGGPKSPLLSGKGWWMTMAFFSLETRNSAPRYRVRAHMLPSGVSTRLRLIYGEFAVDAVPQAIEKHPDPTC